MNQESGELGTYTLSQLLTLHNSLIKPSGAAANPLTKWNKPKAALIGAIAEMMEQVTRREREEKYQEFKRDTIRDTSLALLCYVDYLDDADGRTVGVPYKEIISAVHALFPGCETSVACLRWYAVKVRAEEKGYENFRLPQKRARTPISRASETT